MNITFLKRNLLAFAVLFGMLPSMFVSAQNDLSADRLKTEIAFILSYTWEFEDTSIPVGQLGRKGTLKAYYSPGLKTWYIAKNDAAGGFGLNYNWVIIKPGGKFVINQKVNGKEKITEIQINDRFRNGLSRDLKQGTEEIHHRYEGYNNWQRIASKKYIYKVTDRMNPAKNENADVYLADVPEDFDGLYLASKLKSNGIDIDLVIPFPGHKRFPGKVGVPGNYMLTKMEYKTKSGTSTIKIVKIQKENLYITY